MEFVGHLRNAQDRSPLGWIPLQLEHNLNDDPFHALNPWREEEVFWCKNFDGFWVATRYSDCQAILQDAATFTSSDAFTPQLELSEPLLPTQAEQPYLQQLRSIVFPHLSPGRVASIETTMREVLADIISCVRDAGACDMVNDVARQYPIRVFGKLFGLPRDQQDEFREQAESFLHDVSGRSTAWSRIRAIVSQQLDAKRQQPSDDLLSAIANGRIDGELLSSDVAVSLASTVFVGGLDTLPSSIGWFFRYLAGSEEARHRLRGEPKITMGAVEELLRMWTVTAKEHRRAVRDVRVGNAVVRAGDRIIAFVGLANRDSAQFPDPLRVDFDRSPNPHLAFAVGAHKCLGRHLARHELRVLLEEWHILIPDYRIPEGGKVRYTGGGVFGIESLPLEWSL
jgi:cytochrome P450